MRTGLIFLLIIVSSLLSCTSGKNERTKKNKGTQVEEKVDFQPKFEPLESQYVDQKKQEVSHWVSQILDLDNFSGSILVAKRGEVIFESYHGFKSYHLNHKINSNTALHLASVSKTLTATAILRLVDAGKLDLDQTVKSVLRQFPYPDITIRNLLNHRSGLQKYEYFTDSKEIWGRRKLLSNRDILKLLDRHKLPLYFQPDTKFAYCNTNYAMLALVIEKVTKKSYGPAMEELVFEPLEMNATYVFDYYKDRFRSSQSYMSNYTKIPFMNLDAVYGDKNIYSTPRDMLKYDMAMYNDEFVSASLKKEMYRGYSYERHGVNNYGLGIRLKEWSDTNKLFYHHGWWHGNTSNYLTLKSDTVTIVALSNKFNRRIYSLTMLGELFKSSGDSLDPMMTSSNKRRRSKLTI